MLSLPLIVVLLLLLLSSGDVAPDDSSSAVDDRMVSGNIDFSLRLYRFLAEENRKEGDAANEDGRNILFSPFSITMALGMLHQGAAGQTERQLAQAFGIDGNSSLESKSAVATNLTSWSRSTFSARDKSNDTSSTLSTANALFPANTVDIAQDYKLNLETNFQAEVIPVDYAKEAAKAQKLINDWCSRKTNGVIPSILSEPPATSTRLMLLNAIYFKGFWKAPFHPEANVAKTFHGQKQEYHNVTFMNLVSGYRVAPLDNDEGLLLEVPYNASDLALYILLPSNETDLATIRRNLTADYIDKVIDKLTKQRVHLFVPKFTSESTFDLTDSLQALGINDAFTSRADLSPITSKGEPLQVDKVIHRARIVVNEEGTEAAAVTGTIVSEIAIISPPLEIHLDRPFTYLIRNRHTRMILFVGEVNRF